MIAATAALCLALNVYHESRGQLIPGQYAVALVTMNRAKVLGRVCATVFAPKQFSWANHGVHRTRAGWVIPTALQPRDEGAWQLAQTIANRTLGGRMPDFTWGATFYHTTAVSPAWRHAMVDIKTIGDHRFYAVPQ